MRGVSARVKQLVSAAVSTGGRSLVGDTRELMEHGFGERLDGVRLHFTEASGAANRALGSLAFAVDGHICFQPGFDETCGKAFTRVLAHEMAHVVQKKRGATERRSGTASSRQLEREAHRAAERVFRQERVAAPTADAWQGPRCWGPEGHYYTILWASLAAGLPLKDAIFNSFFAQMPDQVAQLDAIPVVGIEAYHYVASFPGTFEAEVLAGLRHVPLVRGYIKANPWMEQYWEAGANQQIDEMVVQWTVQTGLHALTGGDAEAEIRRRSIILQALKLGTFEFALALHPFGDAFAHQASGSYAKMMYPAPLGHLFKGEGADRIDLRQRLYKRYGLSLLDLFFGKKCKASPPADVREAFEKQLQLLCQVSDPKKQRALLLDFAGAAYSQAPATSPQDWQLILRELYRPEDAPTHAFGYCSATWAEFYAANHWRTNVPLTEDLLSKALVCASQWGTGSPIGVAPELLDFLKAWGEAESRMAVIGQPY